MGQIYLIVGACGTGKTWVARKIIEKFNLTQDESAGLYKYKTNGVISVIGVYDGSIFEGSDRLSMSVMTSNLEAQKVFYDQFVIAEGDRFTNKTFIQHFEPYVVKILGDGSEGRKLRGSSQTERHIKSIQTRVNNIPQDFCVSDSKQCLDYLCETIIKNIIRKAKPKFIEPKSQNLFEL